MSFLKVWKIIWRQNMKTINKVLHQLNTDERTRDDDNLLIAKIWYAEYQNKDVPNDVIEFLKMFANGNLTSPESIRRCRQKLQEEYQGLRGKNWMARHNVNFKQIFKS